MCSSITSSALSSTLQGMLEKGQQITRALPILVSVIRIPKRVKLEFVIGSAVRSLLALKLVAHLLQTTLLKEFVSCPMRCAKNSGIFPLPVSWVGLPDLREICSSISINE